MPKPSRRSSREKPKVVYDEDAMDVDLGLLEDADGSKKGEVCMCGAVEINKSAG